MNVRKLSFDFTTDVVVIVVIIGSLVYDAIMSLYKYSLRLSLCCDRIMPPRPMNQATIERLITERVTAAVEAERQRQGNARGQENNEAGGQGVRMLGLEAANQDWSEFDITASPSASWAVQLCPEMVPSKARKSKSYIQD
ncbi:hypothetical protein Tco_0752644 [Tanacetum coccineum]|uniref:Uncharacterized protein n=1 Tax=Tanacetum coccineum TaxID=301880 RepID=A0ABQ4ZB11_9ASTR